MPKRILITGGAGFIGSHVADELLRLGHHVRVLDTLSAQVHGEARARPSHLDPAVELMVGDVTDPGAVDKAVAGMDAVYHFAAMVGAGQSMYRINDYTMTNNSGTAVLLEALSRRRVGRLVVASSMSIYGEGLYLGTDGRAVQGRQRPLDRLKARDWDPRDLDGLPLEPVPTPETKVPDLASVYALSKFDQERLCLIVGQAHGIPTVALRFFNVYGPRQALSNPRTGVLAIFASRLLNDLPPLVFEDGEQRRDFVNVRDVARACALALDADRAAGRAINIGSGHGRTVNEVAQSLAALLGRDHIAPEITRRHRAGDIRHCFADITLARELLGHVPRVPLETGLEELAEWLHDRVAINRGDEADRELVERGLTV